MMNYKKELFFKNLKIIRKIDEDLYKIILNKVQNENIEKYFNFFLKKHNMFINDKQEIIINNNILLTNKFIINFINKIKINNLKDRIDNPVVIKFIYNFVILEKLIESIIINSPIIIIIENMNLFILYLYLKDISFLNININEEKTKFLFIYNGINQNNIDFFIINNIKKFYKLPFIVSIKRYEQFFNEQINYLFKFFFNRIDFVISDVLTYINLLYFQIKSIFRNLHNIKNTIYLPKNDKEILLLKRKLQKKAIIISAGYSISNLNFSKLKLLKNEFYIIAVDTAYRILKLNRITPDITIILDSQILNYYDFLFLEVKNETFLVDISANHKIVKKLKNNNNTILFFSSVLENIKREWSAPSILAHQILISSNLAKIPTYGNITLAAISFANYFFSEIYILGFDRGFNKYIYHCKHSLDYYYHFNNQNYVNTFNSLQINFTLKKKVGIKTTENFIKLNNLYNSKFKIYKNIKIVHEYEYEEFLNTQKKLCRIKNDKKNSVNLNKYLFNKNINIWEKNIENDNNVNNNNVNNENINNDNIIKNFKTKFVFKNRLDLKNALNLIKNSIEIYYDFGKFKFRKKIINLFK